MKEINTLHLFLDYLHPTQTWVYHLLESTPEVNIHIAARFYLKKNFFHPDFTFIEDDLESVHRLHRALSRKKQNNLSRKVVFKLLPALLGSFEKKLVHHVQENQIQLIHAHFAPTAWSYRNLIRQLNLPLVISFYGYDYEKLPFIQPAYQKHYQWLFKHAQSIVCEGPHGASIIQKLGCPPHKIDIIPLGVKMDQSLFVKRTKSKNELRLIQVASFTEKKGQIYSVQAFQQALKNCPNMHLTLVGDDKDGDWKTTLDNYVHSHGLGEKIKIQGAVHHSDLPSLLQQFHVFIHPSCYTIDRDCEGGAPIVLLDAQINGLPVISTNHCDIPMEVIHEKTGLLCQERDIGAIASNIETFYSMDQDEYSAYASLARKHVLEKFDIAKSGQALSTLYQELLK